MFSRATHKPLPAKAIPSVEGFYSLSTLGEGKCDPASIGTEPCLPSYLFKQPSPCPPDLSSRITSYQHPSLTPDYPRSLMAALSLGSGFQGKMSCLVSSTLHSVKEQEAYPGYIAPCLPPCCPPHQSWPASTPC